MKKIISSLLTIFSLSLILSFSSASATEIIPKDVPKINIGESLLIPTSDSTQEIGIFGGVSRPSLENIGAGLGITKMSNYQATRFVNGVGYSGSNAVHEFKIDALKGVTTKIAEYDMYYLKNADKQVWLLRKTNLNQGINTGYVMTTS